MAQFWETQITRVAHDRFLGWTELVDDSGQPVCPKGSNIISSDGRTPEDAIAIIEQKKARYFPNI